MQSIVVSMSVHLSVHTRTDFETTCPDFTKFSVCVTCGHKAVTTVDTLWLPFLWMMCCFPIMGCMACGIFILYMSAMLEQTVINLQCIPRWRHTVILSLYTLAALCTRDVSDDDMRATAIGWWPASSSILKAGDKVCYLWLPCVCSVHFVDWLIMDSYDIHTCWWNILFCYQ